MTNLNKNIWCRLASAVLSVKRAGLGEIRGVENKAVVVAGPVHYTRGYYYTACICVDRALLLLLPFFHFLLV